MEGDTYGVEIWGAYRVYPWWRLTAGVANRHGSQVEGHDLLQASTTAIWL